MPFHISTRGATLGNDRSLLYRGAAGPARRSPHQIKEVVGAFTNAHGMNRLRHDIDLVSRLPDEPGTISAAGCRYLAAHPWSRLDRPVNELLGQKTRLPAHQFLDGYLKR